MKESHDEGPASQIDPESCVGNRKAVGEALTKCRKVTILAYIAGLAPTLFIVVIFGAISFGPNPRWDTQAKPGAEAWSVAWAIVGIAALLSALILPLSYLSTRGYGRAWARRSFLIGLLSGLCLGGFVDGICICASRGWK